MRLADARLQGVDHDELLHDVEVDRVGVTLQNEAVGAADTVRVMNVDLAVGEHRPFDGTELHPENGEATSSASGSFAEPENIIKRFRPGSSIRWVPPGGAVGAQRSQVPLSGQISRLPASRGARPG